MYIGGSIYTGLPPSPSLTAVDLAVSVFPPFATTDRQNDVWQKLSLHAEALMAFLSLKRVASPNQALKPRPWSVMLAFPAGQDSSARLCPSSQSMRLACSICPKTTPIFQPEPSPFPNSGVNVNGLSSKPGTGDSKGS